MKRVSEAVIHAHDPLGDAVGVGGGVETRAQSNRTRGAALKCGDDCDRRVCEPGVPASLPSVPATVIAHCAGAAPS